jgi:hypothetical protein
MIITFNKKAFFEKYPVLTFTPPPPPQSLRSLFIRLLLVTKFRLEWIKVVSTSYKSTHFVFPKVFSCLEVLLAYPAESVSIFSHQSFYPVSLYNYFVCIHLFYIILTVFYSQSIYLTSILILSSHLLFRLSSGRLPRWISSKLCTLCNDIVRSEIAFPAT